MMPPTDITDILFPIIIMILFVAGIIFTIEFNSIALLCIFLTLVRIESKMGRTK